jgi:sec-independent protein translocase protein TatC
MADDLERLDEEDEGGPVKSFLEHLEDLRWVLIKSIATLAVAMFVCLLAGNYVVGIIKWPLSQARVHYPATNQIVTVRINNTRLGTYQLNPEQKQAFALSTNRFVAIQLEPVTSGTNHYLSWHVDPDPAVADEAQRAQIELINLSPAGGFFVAFQVAFYGGMVLAGPFLFYFIATFVFPALKLNERKYVYRGLFYGGGLFIAGVAFCYFVLMPIALSASQLYSQWLGLGAYQWKAEDYISFVCKFMLGMGLGFELPVVILTLVKIGVIGYPTLAKARRYMIVINLILGAVLTTPEVITQLTMFVPLQFLYEVSVWVAWYWEQPDRAKARRRLIAVICGIIALGVLIWLAYQYGWPWMQNQWHRQN